MPYPERGRVAVAGDIDHRLTIHGHGEGAAEGKIVERLAVAIIRRREIHGEEDQRARRKPVFVMVRILGHIGLLDIRQERPEPVQFACRGGDQRLIVVGDLGETHAVDLKRLGVPVVWVAALDVFLCREATDLGQRSAADRLRRVGEGYRIVDVGPDMLRHDIDLGDGVGNSGVDAVEAKSDRVVVDDRNLIDQVPDVADVEDPMLA